MDTTAATWDDLRVLLALHRHGSFLGAGRALGVSTSTAARRIQALETALARPLVQRSTSGTVLEPDALDLVAIAEQLELGLAAIHRDDAGAASALGGTVRLSVGEGFVAAVSLVLAAFRRGHPETSFELVVETRLADLVRREADLAIRTTRSTSSVLVERSLGRLGFGLYASRDYVQRRLRSARLGAGDVARHDFVGPDGPLARLPQARWLVALGATRFPFRSTSDLAILDATERGHGIAVLPRPVGDRSAELVAIEVSATPPSIDVFLVVHRDRRKVPRIRAVADALASAFRARLR